MLVMKTTNLISFKAIYIYIKKSDFMLFYICNMKKSLEANVLALISICFNAKM